MAVACSAAFALIPVVAERLQKCEEEGRQMQVKNGSFIQVLSCALLFQRSIISFLQVVCIVSGGNVDLTLLNSYFGKCALHSRPQLRLTLFI